MLLIWKGTGILVPLIAAISVVMTTEATKSFGGEDYLDHHHWPFSLGMALGSVAIYGISRLESLGQGTFYFLTMRTWSIILAVLAGASLLL